MTKFFSLFKLRAAVLSVAGAFACVLVLQPVDALAVAAKKPIAKPSTKTTQKSNPKLKKVSRVVRAPAVPDIGKDGGPNLLSHAAVVYDALTGRSLYTKNADNAMPIASITKLMTAMVVLDAKQSLDEAIVISEADIDTLKSSRSRLPIGSTFRREDLMRLALMASDNRAAAALGRTYPGGSVAFVTAMNAKAQSIRLTQAHFVDPTGLAPGNVASPQDLAVLVAAASEYKMIREFSTTPELHVTLPDSGKQIGFNNTNSLVKSEGWNIGLSKTGFINEAGKCLVMQATINNNPVVIVLLDSWGRLTRIGDANRVKKWLETAKVSPYGVVKAVG
jgi:serine-type D-Ala-D-Ala endopeptidase (penicillin-binding protein 7)